MKFLIENFRYIIKALFRFGLPSLLEDPSFANVVFSMGSDVQSWTVEQSAAFVQDFGFGDGAEAFVREVSSGLWTRFLKPKK